MDLDQIIYKLGGIESQLASLVRETTTQTESINNKLASQDKKIEAQGEKLDNHINAYKGDRRFVLGGAAVIAFIVTILKGVADKWLSLNFHL